MSVKNFFFILLAAIFVSVAYGLLRLTYFVKVAGRVVEKSTAYEQNPKDPDMKILILGDSTALGTGAKDPANSVAGRLGRDFPNAKIENRAINGMKSQQLLENLEQFLNGESYDLTVIHIGANDVLRLKNLSKTKQNIHKIIDKSLEYSHYVALFTSGNIGEASLIPWFVRPLMSSRSRALRNFGISLDAELENMAYVDLYYKDAGIANERFYAEDMLHLSGEGYGFWYQELRAALSNNDMKL